MNTHEPKKTGKNYYLLDSCMIEYLLNESINPPLVVQLRTWADSAFNFAISQITYAEIIDGARLNKESKIIDLLDKFNSFPIDKRVLMGCGKLGSVYASYSSSLKDVSPGDKIIAATSIINKIPLITANLSDFPAPFFRIITDANIIYKKNNKQIMIYIGVLFPNYQYLQHVFKKRE